MINKVYKILDDIDNLDIKKRLDDIKKEINDSDNIKLLIKRFNNAKEMYEKYNTKEEFIKAKTELMSNAIIKRYLEIQNEFNMLTLYINDNIKQITGNRNCDK